MPFWKKKPKISGPTTTKQSKAAEYLRRIAANGDLDATTKAVITASLMSVGTLEWGKQDSPSMEWDAPRAKPPQGVNCWTAVIYWAYMGGAIDAGNLSTYCGDISQAFKDGGNPAKDPVFEKHLRYRWARADLVEHVEPGSTIFFSVPGRPLSHVVLALGGEDVVSCWQVRSHPAALTHPEISAGTTHIIDIPTLKDICGGAHCTVKATPGGYWKSPE
jgi:hypothetical protein